MVSKLLDLLMDWETFNSFMTEVPIIMIGTSVMKELINYMR